MAEVVEDIKGKIRDKPIQASLKLLLGQAGEVAGVDRVVVTSGGQAAEGSGGKRTGSTRHDHGNAADLHLVNDGNILDFTKKVDLPVFEAFVRAAAALGATGIGAGVSYMGPQTVHIGYGSKAIWGGSGKSAGTPAPKWLVKAVEAGWANPIEGETAAMEDTAPGLVGNFLIVATMGLRLRAGPGLDFEKIRSLPYGTVVQVAGFDGAGNDWAKVDLEGDGRIDGHMHRAFLAQHTDSSHVYGIGEGTAFEPDADSVSTYA